MENRDILAYFRVVVVNYHITYNSYNKYREHNNLLNPFVPNAPFLYPLKTSENLTVFLCFQGLEKGCIGNKWVKVTLF